MDAGTVSPAGAGPGCGGTAGTVVAAAVITASLACWRPGIHCCLGRRQQLGSCTVLSIGAGVARCGQMQPRSVQCICSVHAF